MNALTLTYNGVTQSLAAWFGNDAQPIKRRRSRDAGSFKIRIPGGDPALAQIIPFGGLVVITDVTNVATPVTVFVGKRRMQPGHAQPRGRFYDIEFLDCYDELKHIVYQQQANSLNVDGLTITTFPSPNVWLFYNNGTTPWQSWSAAQQIADIIAYARSAGAAIQAGVIDPVITMPAFPASNITCAEAINLMVQSLADVYTWVDYTTNDGHGNPLPTLHIRQRQNCAPKTLPYANGNPPAAGTTQVHISTDITRRDDLLVPEVAITYLTTTGIRVVPTQDNYPPGNGVVGYNGAAVVFNITGAIRNTVTGEVTALATDPTSYEFWETIKPDLAGDDIDDLGVIDGTINGGIGHPNGITIIDDSGNPVSLANYPNRIAGDKPGGVAPWMQTNAGTQIVAKEVTITAYLEYTKLTADGHNIQTLVTNHQVTWRGRLTNSAVGTVNYTALASAVAPEIPPANLAYQWWCSANNVPLNLVRGVPTPPAVVLSITSPQNFQWEGAHTIIETDHITTEYHSGMVLNLSSADGGNPDWAVMNAAITDVEYDYFAGKTIIQFGPHKTLTIAQFFGILMMARLRTSWMNPNVQNTGSDPAGSGVQMPTDHAKENTVEHTTPTRSTDSTQGPVTNGTYWAHVHDAGSGIEPFDTLPALHIMQYDAATGVQVADSISVQSHLSDVANAEGAGVSLTFRKRAFRYKRYGDCEPCYVWLECTEEIEGDPPSGAEVVG